MRRHPAPAVLKARKALDRILLRATLLLGAVAVAGWLGGRTLGGGAGFAMGAATIALTVLPLVLVGALALGLPSGAFLVTNVVRPVGGADRALRRDALLGAAVLAAVGVVLTGTSAGAGGAGSGDYGGGSVVAGSPGGLVLVLMAGALALDAARRSASSSADTPSTGTGPPRAWALWTVGVAALLVEAAATAGTDAPPDDPGGLVTAAVLALGVPVAGALTLWRVRASVGGADGVAPDAAAGSGGPGEPPDPAEATALLARAEEAEARASVGDWPGALALLEAEPPPPWWGRSVVADALVRVARDRGEVERLEPLIPWAPGVAAVDAAMELRADAVALRALEAVMLRGGPDAALARQRVGAHDWRRLDRLEAFRRLAAEHGLERDPVYEG